MSKARAPVSMPEILRLRGIPVIKKSTLSEGEKRHYTYIATSTRHLMIRLCNEGLIIVDKEQISFWSLRFTLTPAGQEAAKECEEFLSYTMNLQNHITATLEARSQSIHDRMLPRVEKGHDISTGHSPKPLITQIGPNVEHQPLAVKPIGSKPNASARSPLLPPKVPTTAKVPQNAKVSIPPKNLPSIAPHATVNWLSKPVSRMLRCPNCKTEFPFTSVKRRVDRHDNFECDTCGMDLIDLAYALIECVGVGAESCCLGLKVPA